MLRLSRQRRCVYIRVENENIAHFFHEQLQYLWLLLSTVRDRTLAVYTDAKQPWNRDITRTVVEGLGFEFLERRPRWWQMKTIDLLPGMPTIFCRESLNQMRDLIYRRYLHSSPPPSKKRVLYTRGDAFRRRMLNHVRLTPLFDIVVNSLQLSFQEHVQLFSSASHFVSIEGAHMTNLVLMQPDASVLSIQVNFPNSWPILFGTSSLVRSFDADFIARGDMLVKPMAVEEVDTASHNGRRVRGSGEHDMNVYINDELFERVVSFLSKQ